jgi:2'-5' RNA ligase
MLTELRAQRIALSIEVDRASSWRKSAALDPIRKGLEARLTALDKAIKAEVEKAQGAAAPANVEAG